MVNNYRRILDVATKLMSEKGFHGASIQKIADEVGVTKSTIFHHFKNKEGILTSILDEVGPAALDGLKVISEDENLSGLEKLKEALRFYLNLVTEKGELIHLLTSESRHLSDRNKVIYLETQRSFINLFEHIVKQVQRENGRLYKKLRPKIVTFAVLGMCNWAIMWYRKQGKLDADGITEHFYDIVTGGGLENKKSWI